MPSSSIRQLLICLDAMEWDLVKRWATEGKLPTFQRLLKEGAHGELETTSGQLPDTVWASICTGTNPGKFEKYFYVQYDPPTGKMRIVPDDAINGVPFWQYLSESGKRVCIVDVPKFPLSRGINGLHLANWGAHATKTARASFPESLLADIDRLFGHHPVGDCDMVDEHPDSLLDLRRRILAGVHLHGELFRWLMEKEQKWDTFLCGFSAPHCIGHHFWHYLDRAHPRHDASNTHGLNDSIELIYRALDDEIAKLLTQVGNKTQCLILAGHGMGPLYHASWNLNEILDFLGYGQDSQQPPTKTSGQAKVNPWRTLKMMLPGKVQYAVKKMLPQRLQDELIFKWYAGTFNLQNRRAFAVPNNDSVGAIRINVIGRDKHGVVKPGDEYDRICHNIADAMYEMIDPKTGRKVVKLVSFTHRKFHGPFVEQLPDLTVLWDQSFPWDSVQSHGLGTLHLPRQDARSGSHSPHGFFLMQGQGVPAGRAIQGHSIYDIAPTVLHLAGIAIPGHLDGKPINLAC